MNAAVKIAAPLADWNAVQQVTSQGWPDDLPQSTYALIQRAADRFGDAKALSFFLEAKAHRRTSSWTFRRYFEAVTRTANLFHRLCIGPDDVVALVLPNLPETYFCLWGGEAAGIALPINPLLEPGGIADLLRAAKARIVVTVAPFPGSDLYEKVSAAVAESPDVTDLVTVDLAQSVLGWKALPARLKQAQLVRAAKPLRPGIRVTRYHKAIADVAGDRLESGRTPKGDDVASYFGTGGSTGAPKLAMRTHANEVANTFMSTRMLGDGLAPGEVIFAGLPLFHVNGALVTGLSPLLTGGHVLLGTPQGYRGPGLISRFWDIVEQHRVSFFSGVPTLFSSLMQTSPKGKDLSSLRFAICGAAPMAPELIAQFEQATDIRILEGYGLTEATCVASVNPLDGVRKAGSVGLPLPFQATRIAVLDDQDKWVRDAAIGETGTIALSGPNVFLGYRIEAQNKGLWLTDIDGAQWLNTGDLGALDADGYLWLKGRTKDVIIRGGHNIDPAMIEDAFYAHPAVALAAAIGRADEHAGEVPVVYVELKPGQTVDEAALLAFADERIMERSARPKAIYILPTLPLTAIGKVFKPELRRIDQERLG